jgi:hypothetical protein
VQPQIDEKTPAVPTRKSITPDFLICLDDKRGNAAEAFHSFLPVSVPCRHCVGCLPIGSQPGASASGAIPNLLAFFAKRSNRPTATSTVATPNFRLTSTPADRCVRISLKKPSSIASDGEAWGVSEKGLDRLFGRRLLGRPPGAMRPAFPEAY